MNKYIKLGLLSLSIATTIGYSTSSFAVTENTQADINILSNISISCAQTLNAGDIVRPSVAATTNAVAITTAGVVSISGTGDAFDPGSGTKQAASCTVTAIAGETIDVSATPGAAVNGMTLQNMVSNYDSTAGAQAAIETTADSYTALASATLLIGGEIAGISPTTTLGGSTLLYDLEVAYQ